MQKKKFIRKEINFFCLLLQTMMWWVKQFMLSIWKSQVWNFACRLTVFSGFPPSPQKSSGAVEYFTLLWCYMTYVSSWLSMFQDGPSVSSSTAQQSKKNSRNRWMHYYMEDCVGGDWLLVKVMESVRFVECEVSSFFLFILWQLSFLCLFSTFSPCPGSNFKLQQPLYSPVPSLLP